jgi:hypothetical protein
MPAELVKLSNDQARRTRKAVVVADDQVVGATSIFAIVGVVTQD